MAHSRHRNKKKQNQLITPSTNQLTTNLDRASSLTTMPPETVVGISSFFEEKKDMVAYAITCKNIYALFQPNFDQHDLIELLQAGLVNDRPKILKLLEKKPRLLVTKPKIDTMVESKFTWQLFFAEALLPMLVKRNQRDMIKWILPYYNNIKDGPRLALEQWKLHEPSKEEELTKYIGYTLKIEELIQILRKDSCPNNPINNSPFYRANEQTTLAINSFRAWLFPNQGIHLDDYIDTLLLLIACVEVYLIHMDTLSTAQRIYFATCVFGAIESVQNTETIDTLMDAFDKSIPRKAPLTDTKNGPIYRKSRDECSGLGYHTFITGQKSSNNQIDDKANSFIFNRESGCVLLNNLRKHREEITKSMIDIRNNIEKPTCHSKKSGKKRQ